MIRKSYRQASVHEYINITKQLPSTNPIRSPTPDIHSRKERIEKTMSPNIAPNRTHLKNITNSNSKYQNLNQNKDFERILEAKDEKILSLQKELEILQRNPNSFSMKNSDFHNKAPKEQEEMVEKLRILIKAKEDENQDLRKKMEMSLQESNAKTDNKIREILLKFYQEINVLKAENKQLTDLMEHKNPQQQHIHVEGKYMDPYNNNVNDHSISEKSSKNSRIIDNNPRLNESNHKPYIPEQQHGYTPDHNHQLDKSQTTPFNNNPEKSKKANQHIQGGTISPYHEPQPLSATFNVIVDESVPKLKSHIAERDVKIRVLAEELEKINDVLKMKNQENIELLERIKRNNHGDYDESIKLKQLLQSKLQELEDLKTKLPKEDNEKLKALALRTPALLDEIKELNEVITKLRKEHHENEEKMVALAHEVERLADLLKHQANNHSNTQYYDEKIALLAQEIERLNEMVKNQNNELQRLRPLEPQMEALKREHEILADKHINKNKALEAKLKELELLKEKCLLIDKAFSAEKEGLHEKAEMLEKKAHSLITENQDLSRLHRKSIEEKNAHENEALKLIGLNQELVQEIKSLTDALKNKHQENEFKTQEIESLKSRLNEVEMHKANVLSSHEFEKKKSITVIQENDRKNLLIDNLTQEINSLRNRLLEQESKGFTQEKEHEKLKKSHQEAVQNMGSLQNQIEFIQGRHQEKVQNSEVELKQKEADLREVKQKLMNLEQEKTNEISKVRDSISESYMKQEHEKRKTLGVMAEKEGLQMECEVLRKERKDFQHKCQELKKSLFQSESETNKLKAQNEEFLLRIVLLSALNETLSNDMNEIRENHSDLNNKFMKLNNEKSIEELKLKESLNETQKHHEREKRKSIQILQEKESINKTLDMVARDKEDLHKRLYDNEVKQIELQSQLKQISSKYEEALIRVAVMSCELQRLLENIDNDSNMKRIHIEEVRKDCEEKLKAANDRKRKEFDDLKQENEHESKRLLTMIHGLEEQNEALIRKHASDRSDFIAKYEKAMKETIVIKIVFNFIYRYIMINFWFYMGFDIYIGQKHQRHEYKPSARIRAGSTTHIRTSETS